MIRLPECRSLCFFVHLNLFVFVLVIPVFSSLSGFAQCLIVSSTIRKPDKNRIRTPGTKRTSLRPLLTKLGT